MSARGLALALALVAGGIGGAQAAVISTAANAPLTSAPATVSFGDGMATYTFTAVSGAATGNGPGAAVATGGTALVSSFFGAVTDFGAGSTIDANGLYGFSAFPSAAVIPNSPANDFIGLAFTLQDGLHYGYAQVFGPTLVGYAYESVPGVGIVTGAMGTPTGTTPVPEPATFALLGAGLAGLAAVRRRPSRTA